MPSGTLCTSSSDTTLLVLFCVVYVHCGSSEKPLERRRVTPPYPELKAFLFLLSSPIPPPCAPILPICPSIQSFNVLMNFALLSHHPFIHLSLHPYISGQRIKYQCALRLLGSRWDTKTQYRVRSDGCPRVGWTVSAQLAKPPPPPTSTLHLPLTLYSKHTVAHPTFLSSISWTDANFLLAAYTSHGTSSRKNDKNTSVFT